MFLICSSLAGVDFEFRKSEELHLFQHLASICTENILRLDAEHMRRFNNSPQHRILLCCLLDKISQDNFHTKKTRWPYVISANQMAKKIHPIRNLCSQIEVFSLLLFFRQILVDSFNFSSSSSFLSEFFNLFLIENDNSISFFRIFKIERNSDCEKRLNLTLKWYIIF